MRIFSQIYKKLAYVILFILLYILISFIVISIFALVYSQCNIENCWRSSCLVYWGVDYGNEIKSISIIEICVKNLLDLSFIATTLAKLTQPLNPILFANQFVYDTVDKRVYFRYWIMYPELQYLYDAQIKVRLLSSVESNYGSEVSPIWSATTKEYSLIRGIRYIDIPPDETEVLLQKIHNMKKKDAKKSHLDVIIKGTNSNGKTYVAVKRYYPNYLLYGYKFVPFREYSTQLFLDKHNGRMKLKELNTISNENPRYQYFDKVYAIVGNRFPENLTANEEKKISKDVITDADILCDKSLKNKLMCMFSKITYVYLDSALSRKLHRFFDA